jgi:hypothetical protein
MGDLVKTGQQPAEKATKDNIEKVKLNIVMLTNKNSTVKIAGNLFVFDDNNTIKGDYPYLCTNVSYNREYFNTKNSFYEKVQVFFSEAEFDKFVLEQNKNIITESHEITQNIKNNIQMMLEILFPISFPVNDEVTQMSGNSEIFDLNKMINKILRRSEYVYLNIDKPSTVVQAIWLDTISSHPKYVQLYESMKEYKKKLVSYVLDSYVRKGEAKLDFDGINSAIREILKKALDYRDSDKNKFLTGLESKRNRAYQKIIKEDRRIMKEPNAVKKENMRKENEKDKKETLIDQVRELKDILKRFNTIEFNDEIARIESQLKVNETGDKREITKIFQSYKNGLKTDDDMRKIFEDYKSHGSTWWKLYFMFAGLKKNTKAFNTFVEEYVKKFVLRSTDDSTRYYGYYNSQSSNESKFYKNLSDLDFHFDFLKDVDEFVKQERKPLIQNKFGTEQTMLLSEVFKEDEEQNVVRFDTYLTLYNDDKIGKGRKEYTGVDVIREPKSTNETDKTKIEYKTKVYEIQMAIAVVGGKIPKAPSTFWCAFNSAKLANDYKFLTKYNLGGEIHLYPFVEIEENPPGEDAKPTGVDAKPKAPPAPQAPQAQQFNTIVNLKQRGGRRTRSKRSFAKKNTHKRSFQRNSKEKQARYN